MTSVKRYVVLLAAGEQGVPCRPPAPEQVLDIRESPYPHLVVSQSHDGPTKTRRVREVPLLPEAQDVRGAMQ